MSIDFRPITASIVSLEEDINDIPDSSDKTLMLDHLDRIAGIVHLMIEEEEEPLDVRGKLRFDLGDK